MVAVRVRDLPKALKALLLTELALVLLLAGSAYVVWRAVPTEGVKLHGNIDTGIDLLGNRSDILWIAAAGIAMALGNVTLALMVRGRERLASLFLLGTAAPILFGFSGILWFIFLLNAPR